MARPSCMGGWCQVRDRCGLHVAIDRSTPSERLCEPGQKDHYEPLYFTTRPAGTWERQNAGLLAPATWTEAIIT